MPGLDFLYSPVGQAYNATQLMENDDLNSTKARLANQHAASMNPLLEQQQGLQNQTLEAQLPGVRGTSKTLAAKGDLDSFALPEQMQLKKQEILGKMDDDQLKRMGVMGDKMSALGSMLDSIPPLPGARRAKFQELASRFGIDPSNPAFAHFADMNDEELPQALKHTGQDLATSSSEFTRKKLLETFKEEAANSRSKGNNETSIKVAEISANARIEAAERRAAQAEARMSISQRIAKLLSVPVDQQDDEWRKQYSDAMQSEATLRAAGANTLGADVIGGRDPSTPASRTQTTIEAVTGTGGAKIPKEKFSASGWAYEPDKYEYRVMPDGRLARKPK